MRQFSFTPICLLAGVLFLTNACTKKNQPAAGTDSLQQAEANLQTSPSFENHIALGLEYANRNMRDQALAMYVKAKDMNPKSPLAWNNICAELNVQGRHGEAVVNCQKAVELEPKFDLARNNLVWTENKIKESKVGILNRKKALLTKKDVTAAQLMAMGFEFYNIQDYTNAVEVWAAIKPGDTEYSKAQNNIATSYIVTDQLDKAEKHIGNALTLEPKNQLFINNKAWLQQKKTAKK